MHNNPVELTACRSLVFRKGLAVSKLIRAAAHFYVRCTGEYRTLLSRKDAIKKIWECFEYLPREKGFEYLILKGHLLAEEEMLNYIKRAIPNPIPIIEGRFSFYQLVQIVEAMRPPGAEPWLWESLRNLNSLRNEMAHNLQPQGFDRKAKELARIVGRHASLDFISTKDSQKETLRSAITLIVGSVYALPLGRKKYRTT